MTLEDWGWTDFFAEQFANWSKKGLLPARVIRGEKNYFRVWSTSGELTVRFAGKIRHQADGRADLPVVGDWMRCRVDLRTTTMLRQSCAWVKK